MPTKRLEELEEKIGESRVTVRDLVIEAGKVEEMARAIKDDNPAFRDEQAAKEQGLNGIPAPLIFTRVSLFPRYQTEEGRSDLEQFGIQFDLSKTVLGEREFEYNRPMYVGDKLTGTTTVTDIFQKKSERSGIMTFAVLETVYRDEHDDPVVRERSTIIERGGESSEEDDD